MKAKASTIILALIFLTLLLSACAPRSDESAVNAAIEETLNALAGSTVTVSSLDSLPPAATNTAVEIPTEIPAADPTENILPSATAIEAGAEQIAFASDRSGRAQIWIINQDGSEKRQLTDMPAGACQPSWSPDGASLVFTSPCLANRASYPGANLYRLEVASGEITSLTEGDEGDYDPAWSPNGDQIIFTSLRLGRSQLFLLILASNEIQAITVVSAYEYQATWTSSGAELAFVSTADGPELIYTGPPSAGQRSQLLSEAASDGKFVSGPAWAPNGDGIYYTRTPRSGGFAELYYFPAPGNPTPHQAVFSEVIPGRDVSPSPDGNWLAFESWPNTSNHDIWISTSAGNNPTRLTSDSGNDFDAAWRP